MKPADVQIGMYVLVTLSTSTFVGKVADIKVNSRSIYPVIVSLRRRPGMVDVAPSEIVQLDEDEVLLHVLGGGG